MPIDSLVLSIAICGVFLVFAVVLASVDHRTTNWQRSRVSENQAAPVAERPRRAT